VGFASSKERPTPRLLSSGVLWRNLVAACPAATIALLVLLPVAAAILATAATRRPDEREADYPAKAQTQELPATHGHSKNGIASGFRFTCIRHGVSPCLARLSSILSPPPQYQTLKSPGTGRRFLQMRNPADIKAYQRAGFKEIGRRRKCRMMGGRLWDEIYMDCLSSEFESPVLQRIYAPDDA